MKIPKPVIAWMSELKGGDLGTRKTLVTLRIKKEILGSDEKSQNLNQSWMMKQSLMFQNQLKLKILNVLIIIKRLKLKTK